jgi:hypothetical protein
LKAGTFIEGWHRGNRRREAAHLLPNFHPNDESAQSPFSIAQCRMLKQAVASSPPPPPFMPFPAFSTLPKNIHSHQFVPQCPSPPTRKLIENAAFLRAYYENEKRRQANFGRIPFARSFLFFNLFFYPLQLLTFFQFYLRIVQIFHLFLPSFFTYFLSNFVAKILSPRFELKALHLYSFY